MGSLGPVRLILEVRRAEQLQPGLAAGVADP